MISINDLLARPVTSMAGFALAAAAILIGTLRSSKPVVSAEVDVLPDTYVKRLVMMAVVGLLGVLSGAYMLAIDRIAWSLPLFAFGFGLWIRLIRQNSGQTYKSPGLRQIVRLSDTALNASLLCGVLVVGNLLAFKYGAIPIDMTREKAFSLSSMTMKQLDTLTTPVTLTVFHNRSPQALRQLERVDQLLGLYKAASRGLIKVEILDRFNEPDRYEALAKKEPTVAVIPDGGIVVSYGEGEKAERTLVRNSEMFQLTGNVAVGANSEFTTEFLGEDVITSALIRLRDGIKTEIAYTVGHGETPFEPDPRQLGLGLLRNRLETIGSELVPLDLSQRLVDPNTKLILIASPKTAFTEAEVNRLRVAIDKDVPVLSLLDPSVKTGLEDLFKELQIEVGSGLVVDPRNNFQGQPNMVVAGVGGILRHPITDPLSGRRVLVPNAGPIRGLPPGGYVKIPLKVEPILSTGSEAWAESTPDRPPFQPDAKEDLRGPLIVGLAVSEPGKAVTDPVKPKLVLFGSGLFADNRTLEISPTNLDVLVNAVTWLRGRPDLLGISPKTNVALTLAVNPGMRARLVIVPTIMSASMIIGLGVATYLARRA